MMCKMGDSKWKKYIQKYSVSVDRDSEVCKQSKENVVREDMKVVQNVDVGTILQIMTEAKEPFDASYSKESKASNYNSSISEEEDESESDEEKSKHSIHDTKILTDDDDGFTPVCSKSQKQVLKKLEPTKQSQPEFDQSKMLLLNQVCFDVPKCPSVQHFDNANRFNGIKIFIRKPALFEQFS
ncbi:hypothetical protein LguiB_023388 [Lonicera macranthoides]